MAMTKEQLLIPRVMCVGGKEGEPNDTSGYFITGEILEMPESASPYYIGESPKTFISKTDIAKFPHLFRPMPWWEGRKPEDMPEYVSHYGGNYLSFHKVLRWEKREQSDNWMWYGENGDFGDFAIWTYDYQYQPATEQEYLDYIKQKEG